MLHFSKNLVNRVATTVVALTLVFSVSAQQGEKSLGGHFTTYMEKDLSMFGIGAKFRYNVTDPIRVEGTFSYFFPKTEETSLYGVSVKTKVNLWEFSANGHYLFPVSDNFNLYPLAGLSMLGITATATAGKTSNSSSDTKAFLNLGGGFDFKLTDTAALNVEAKYLIGSSEGYLMIISAGVVFSF